MKEWLRETHAPGFELLRHFLLRFFDSELITTPGQMTPVLIGTTPFAFQWFFLLLSPLRHKYAYLSGLETPGPYREAVRADELWLITLMMAVIGLLTAIRWQSLFPDLRDYRNLGTLPLRPRQIFGAKLAALLIVASAALIAINFLPALGFPPLSASHWAFESSPGARLRAHAGASLAASSFIFFGLVALQGVLLNLLPPGLFGRVTGYLQGGLVAMMLGLTVLSFSIQPQITKIVVQPEWARWLPPVWFLGLCQTLSGDPDPFMRTLAHRATTALLIVVTVALLSHLVSYRRHRTLLVEGISGRVKDRYRGGTLLGWLVSDPRQQAIVVFMLSTLKRSSYHRMILMGYAGLWLAIILTGLAEMGALVEPSRLQVANFVYFHLITLLFLLIGARHLFSLPTEWKANWVFQITEREGRKAWLGAMDRFALFFGAALMLVIPLPIEVRLLGGRGFAEAGLFLAIGILAYEWAFSSWHKLPFTCSHLPGKMPTWMIMAFFGLAGVIAALHSLLVLTLYSPVTYALLLTGLLAAWIQIRRQRRETWSEIRLKFDELPEPAVSGLNLLR